MRNNIIRQQIRTAMYTSIRGYNRHLPMEVLVNMNLIALLRNCHPIDREDFFRRLDKHNLITVTPQLRGSLFGRTNPYLKPILK